MIVFQCTSLRILKNVKQNIQFTKKGPFKWRQFLTPDSECNICGINWQRIPALNNWDELTLATKCRFFEFGTSCRLGRIAALRE